MISFEKKLRRCLIILVLIFEVVFTVALIKPDVAMRRIEFPDFVKLLQRFQSLSEGFDSQWQIVLDVLVKIENQIERLFQVHETIVR